MLFYSPDTLHAHLLDTPNTEGLIEQPMERQMLNAHTIGVSEEMKESRVVH
jgi:hypothetical protein